MPRDCRRSYLYYCRYNRDAVLKSSTHEACEIFLYLVCFAVVIGGTFFFSAVVCPSSWSLVNSEVEEICLHDCLSGFPPRVSSHTLYCSAIPKPSDPITQVFAALHNHYRWTTGFQVHFISWVVMNLGRCVYVSRDKAMEPATFLLRRAIVASSMGTICWMASGTVYHLYSNIRDRKLIV